MNRLTFFVVLGIVFLGLRFFFFFSNQRDYKDGEEITIETTLLSDVRISGSLQRFTLRDKGTEPLFITTSRFPEYSYGDSIKIIGTVKKRVLENKKTINSIYFPTITRAEKQGFFHSISPVRKKIVRVFENTLPSDSSALLLGIVFGIKRPMSESLRASFETTGLLHVIAASGMNVTMVGGFVTALFSFFFARKKAIILTLFVLLYYAILSGLEPSIVRATIMGGFAYVAQIIGRQSLAWHSLYLTGFVMLFISPQLFFDIGFQLSFLATGGLIFIRPLFELNKKIHTVLARSILGEGFITTLSAQIATMPLLAMYFGTISFSSLLVNALVLWTAPVLMVLGGIAATLGLIIEPLAKVLLFLSYPLLLYFQYVPSLFTSLGIIEFESIPFAFTLGYYFCLISFLLYFKGGKN